MPLLKSRKLRLTDRDLDFLVTAAAPEVADRSRLKEIIREDEDFRNSFITDEQVFKRIMDDEEILLKISPALLFEILLRKAVSDLSEAAYTVEKEGGMKIPVFDAEDVVDLLHDEALLAYLAGMLSSFTRVESYTISFRTREGVLKKIRFNDLDIHTLMGFADAVNDEYRLGFYKRIADICLFILGIFPNYAEKNYRYPFSGQLRPALGGRLRFSPEDYEIAGRKFYKLAATHHAAQEMDLSEVFWTLYGNFQMAKKPLNFISEHYLQYMKHNLF